MNIKRFADVFLIQNSKYKSSKESVFLTNSGYEKSQNAFLACTIIPFVAALYEA